MQDKIFQSGRAENFIPMADNLHFEKYFCSMDKAIVE